MTDRDLQHFHKGIDLYTDHELVAKVKRLKRKLCWNEGFRTTSLRSATCCHPFGAEPVPVSGIAGIRRRGALQ